MFVCVFACLQAAAGPPGGGLARRRRVGGTCGGGSACLAGRSCLQDLCRARDERYGTREAIVQDTSSTARYEFRSFHHAQDLCTGPRAVGRQGGAVAGGSPCRAAPDAPDAGGQGTGAARRPAQHAPLRFQGGPPGRRPCRASRAALELFRGEFVSMPVSFTSRLSMGALSAVCREPRWTRTLPSEARDRFWWLAVVGEAMGPEIDLDGRRCTEEGVQGSSVCEEAYLPLRLARRAGVDVGG